MAKLINLEQLTEVANTLNGKINNIESKLTKIDAISLNGYSLWVGTKEEYDAIEVKDPKTLYFEIGGNEDEEDVIEVTSSNGVLQLTDDKYQKCNNIETGTEIRFPEVTKFTRIHLYLSAETNLNLNFPDCKWRVDPNLEEGKSYEIVATYNTMHWLVNIIVYS